MQSQAFLGQSASQMDLQVRYAGAMPLHLALYQKLRSNPSFAAMKTEANAQQITLCLSGC